MLKNIEMVGLGYCGLDYLGIVPEIPLDDKVEIMENLVQGGGPAATATYTAARLGATTAFVGSTGADKCGRDIVAEMISGGVATNEIAIRDNGESPAAFCWIEAKTGKRSIMWTRGTITPLSKAEVNIELIKNAKILHLDGHQAEAAIFAAQTARANGVTVSLDAGTIAPQIEELVGLADIVIASEKFSERFTGDRTPESAVKKLFTENTKFSAITLGSQGSIGYDGKNIYRQPSMKVEVVDTTGAGDVFHGAFAYKYIQGGNWQECMRFATAVSALKCTKLGGRTGIPSLEATESFLKEYK